MRYGIGFVGPKFAYCYIKCPSLELLHFIKDFALLEYTTERELASASDLTTMYDIARSLNKIENKPSSFSVVDLDFTVSEVE